VRSVSVGERQAKTQIARRAYKGASIDAAGVWAEPRSLG